MTQLRRDLQIIADHVPNGATVLDVGCSEGDLLAYLTEHKQVRGRGIEYAPGKVNRCIARGLSVIQGDANTDLTHYPEGVYDYVILSLTLQTLSNPKEVLEQLVRIGKHVIVSVPNFGHWKNRLYLGLHGRMPVTKTLSYEWYDTPNIHFCTLIDFVALCNVLNITVESQIYVSDQNVIGKVARYSTIANLLAQQGIFMLRR